MIRGIGVDMIEVARIKTSVRRFGGRFLRKIFTDSELKAAQALEGSSRYYGFLAKRFAAKEAYAKALGTGIGSEISFKQIEVVNDMNGRPQLVDLKRGDATLNHVSLSDTKDYAVAYVIIEKI